MLRRRVALPVSLIVLGSSMMMAAATDSKSTSAAFVSLCRTDSKDQVLGDGVLLVLAHEVGQGSTVLYRVKDTGMEPLAELHHDTSTNSEYLEAQGGVRSTAIASDIVAFLLERPFFFVRDWGKAISPNPRIAVVACQVVYSKTKQYDARGE